MGPIMAIISELREATLKKLRVLAKEIATLKRQKAMLGKLLENWPRKKEPATK
jgi:hypothetical protein